MEKHGGKEQTMRDKMLREQRLEYAASLSQEVLDEIDKRGKDAVTVRAKMELAITDPDLVESAREDSDVDTFPIIQETLDKTADPDSVTKDDIYLLFIKAKQLPADVRYTVVDVIVRVVNESNPEMLREIALESFEDLALDGNSDAIAMLFEYASTVKDTEILSGFKYIQPSEQKLNKEQGGFGDYAGWDEIEQIFKKRVGYDVVLTAVTRIPFPVLTYVGREASSVE